LRGRASGRSRASICSPVVVGAASSAASPSELAQLLADDLELAAQQELALRLFHALFYVCFDLLAERYVGQGLARPAEHEPQPGLHVDGLEDL
jgi:hypothetical protein